MDVSSQRRFHQPENLRLEEKKEWLEFVRGSASALDLEIGCGVGWHPLRYAAQNGERRLIAIEHTQEKFERFQRRYHHHGSPVNLLPVHANAVTWVNRFVPVRYLERIFLLYPNPNLQNRAKRWMAMPFMGRLLDSLKPGGELTMATNELWYKDEAIHLAGAHWGLQLISCNEIDLGRVLQNGGPRSHFEKKYLERGQVCFDMKWQKINDRQFCEGGKMVDQVDSSSSLVTVAAGCFWGVEELLRDLPGVISTTVGYTGGNTKNPTYQDVKTGQTGHAEAVQLRVDPVLFSFSDFLRNWFFKLHNPTTRHQQGNDIGSQYRSAIFFHDDVQRQRALDVISEINASGFWKNPIVTEVVSAGPFYSAEEYHQDYLKKNPDGYTCHFLRSEPEGK